MAAPDLTGRTISSTYKDLLQVSNSNAGVDSTSRSVQDGGGDVSAMELSTTGVKSTGTLDVTGNTTLGGDLTLGSTTTVDAIRDEDTMSSDSATSLATQQSIKAYVDTQDGTKADSSHTHTLSDVTDSGTAAAKDVPSTGDASSAQVVMGDDSRLTDARTPSSHTHTLSEVTDSGTAAAKDVPSSGDASSTQVVMGDDSRLTEVTLAGTPDYITISGQEITRNQIDLAADVTGSLPDGNIASAATWNALTTNATHTGEVTGSGALTVADNVIDEANLKVDNAPTDDYVLTAKSSAAGGLTWASAGSGSGDMTGVDITAGDGLDISQSNTTSGDYTATISADLKANGGIVVESTELAVDLGASSITGTLAAGDGGTGLTSISTLLNSNTTASDVGLGSVENTALSTWAGTTNVTTLGTISSGTWNGTTIAAAQGGTGSSSYVTGDILFADSTSTLDKLSADTAGFVLTSNGTGTAPSWQAASGGVGDITAVTAGTGISGGGTSGDVTVNLDLGSLTDDTGNGDTSGWSAGDFVAIVEGGGDEKKIKPPAEMIIAVSDETTAISSTQTGTSAAAHFMVPRAMTVTEVKISLTVKDTSTFSFVEVRIRDCGDDPETSSTPTLITDSVLYASDTGTSSGTAATNTASTTEFNSSSSSYSLDEDDFVRVEIGGVGDGAAQGLKVYLLGYWT